MTKIRCRSRESDKYIDGIRDLTFPREARLVKNCAQDADFVSRECRKPSRPTGSSGQSKLTRRTQSGVCFQTKHPMGCLVNRSLTPVSQMEVRCSRIWGLTPTTQTQVGGTPHKPALPATQPRAPPATPDPKSQIPNQAPVTLNTEFN